MLSYYFTFLNCEVKFGCNSVPSKCTFIHKNDLQKINILSPSLFAKPERLNILLEEKYAFNKINKNNNKTEAAQFNIVTCGLLFED